MAATLQGQAAGEIGRQRAGRVDLGAQLAELRQARVHLLEHRGRDAGVLGQVHPAAVAHDELVEQRAEAGGAGREVKRERPAASNGWKNCPIVCSSPSRSRGALRYHAALASRTVYLLIRPGGSTGGAPSLARGSNSNGSLRAAAGRSLSAAKSPLVMIDRPRPRPLARLSDHATV